MLSREINEAFSISIFVTMPEELSRRIPVARFSEGARLQGWLDPSVK
jgi:hypothetical protein